MLTSLPICSQIWAMDAVEQVAKEVREVIWRTIDSESAAICRTPTGCSRPLLEDPDINDDVPMMHSGGRLRMASISESIRPSLGDMKLDGIAVEDVATPLETTTETDAEYDLVDEKSGPSNRRLSELPFTDLRERDNPLG